jgi:hypothetical protein
MTHMYPPPHNQRLLPQTEKMPVENFSEFEKQYVYMKPAKLPSLKLNRDHTHFILVDDDSLGKFGGESACRSGFERYESLVGLFCPCTRPLY